ncbi:hypothetical protein [Chitinibacter tainanensis]|uniref:hypothetical protein n=1 Tax=Chitinibacter tainanensis TaxID=230667 RepID=UPI002356BEAB|nr:hypothetical protein [Chitinibacter tainanensis]
MALIASTGSSISASATLGSAARAGAAPNRSEDAAKTPSLSAGQLRLLSRISQLDTVQAIPPGALSAGPSARTEISLAARQLLANSWLDDGLLLTGGSGRSLGVASTVANIPTQGMASSERISKALGLYLQVASF